MAGNPNQKMKLLYLAQILLEQSDEDHCLPTHTLQRLLLEKGISSERKSVSNDIKVLQDAGMPIERGCVPTRGYYIAGRDFELAELRMLIDALQSSPFISKKKTLELTEKLCSLTSVHQAKQLSAQVHCGRTKSDNEEILYNIDTIQNAILKGKKIRFIYHHRQLVNNIPVFDAGKDFIVSPYATIWDSDKYYLVGNYQKYDDLSHYRIDRMKKVECLDDAVRPHQEVCGYEGEFDAADYANKVFNMFSGDQAQTIELECEAALLDAIIEHFGVNNQFRQLPDGRFAVKVTAVANEGFARWVLNFGGGVVVKSPQSLIAELRRILFKMNMSYR